VVNSTHILRFFFFQDKKLKATPGSPGRATSPPPCPSPKPKLPSLDSSAQQTTEVLNAIMPPKLVYTADRSCGVVNIVVF